MLISVVLLNLKIAKNHGLFCGLFFAYTYPHMTLTAHAVAGAAVATLAPQNPALAFIFGFLSHYLLDAFPHGHYKVRSHTRHSEDRLKEDMVYGRALIFDLFKIGLDFLLGMTLAYLLFTTWGKSGITSVLLGAFAGILPDALQFAYWKIRREPLISLQKFHIANHATKNFNGDTKKTLLVEIAAIAVSILFVKIISG